MYVESFLARIEGFTWQVWSVCHGMYGEYHLACMKRLTCHAWCAQRTYRRSYLASMERLPSHAWRVSLGMYEASYMSCMVRLTCQVWCSSSAEPLSSQSHLACMVRQYRRASERIVMLSRPVLTRMRAALSPLEPHPGNRPTNSGLTSHNYWVTLQHQIVGISTIITEFNFVIWTTQNSPSLSTQ